MKARRVYGFSLTELVVAMAVAMILIGVALRISARYHSISSQCAVQTADIAALDPAMKPFGAIESCGIA